MPVGVVLIHDITGLDPVNLSFADKLAAEGIGCAAVDVFRSGDEVLVIEEEGRLKEVKKSDNKSGNKSGSGSSTEKKPARK